MMRYRLYGLEIETDRPLRDLPTSGGDAAPDVRVEFAGIGSFSRPAGCTLADEYLERSGLGVAGRRIWTWPTPAGEAVELELFGRGREVWFTIAPDRAHVRATWSANTPPEDLAPTFLGPLLSTLLPLRNQTCLHAGAVAVDAHAIAIVGKSGAGKSTTIIALARRGCAVLSDDLIVLADSDGRCMLEPGEASVRVSRMVAACLWPKTRRLTRVFVSEDKVYAPITRNASAGGADPLPLGAVYVIDCFADAIELEPLRGARAVAALGGVGTRSLLDAAERSRRFAGIVRLVAAVPVRLVRRPRDLFRLDELAQAIVSDARAVVSSP